eukprot:gb/GECG01002290.1/.p1 GENE.gb/GECG01002290.1/~~gb/GECG01002290.1/.p1  ORF type:complete len:511 (+),score=60.30 gb/GECG01002290.1/:1-1533(+)
MDVDRSFGHRSSSQQSTAERIRSAIENARIMDGDSAKEFSDIVARYVDQKMNKTSVDWSRIHPPSEDLVMDHNRLETCPRQQDLRQDLLQKLAIVKLNGGLGTSMGCRGPKSALEVRSDLTFLDMTVRQIEYLNTRYGVDVPLILMNSFNTHDETVKIVRKYADHNLTIHCFMQSCFPVIERDHHAILPEEPFSPETKELWYPPGHGDVYRALARSGVLDKLLDQGKEYVFISNVDNLGATADFDIVYYLINNDIEFAMEVTQRTRADVQGGTLISYQDESSQGEARDGGAATRQGGTSSGKSKPKLLELAQIPAAHQDEFKSLKRFKMFNTNNIWVSLKAVKRAVEADLLKPPVIVTSRVVDDKDVLQLETAAGAAIEAFDKAIGINVSRSRFMPVKSTSDLLVVQSNIYDIKHGSLQPKEERETDVIPVVKLGPEFEKVQDYKMRLKNIPDMLELDHLTVSGNVFFGQKVVLKGTVIIVAFEGARIDIPDNSVLENKVVTGNLRILEH